MRTLGWLFRCAVAVMLGVAVRAEAPGVAPMPMPMTVAYGPEALCDTAPRSGFGGWLRGAPPSACRDYTVCAVVNTDPIFDGADPRPGAREEAALVAFFRAVPPMSYIIAGHTDAQADRDAALRQAQARAVHVAALARRAGADVRRIVTYGDLRPRASNATPEGRAQNRRVEILCLK